MSVRGYLHSRTHTVIYIIYIYRESLCLFDTCNTHTHAHTHMHICDYLESLHKRATLYTTKSHKK